MVTRTEFENFVNKYGVYQFFHEADTLTAIRLDEKYGINIVQCHESEESVHDSTEIFISDPTAAYALATICKKLYTAGES